MTKELPYSEDHEKALISCMLDQPLVHGKEVVDSFDSSPFFIPVCSSIFDAFKRIDIGNISPISIGDYLSNVTGGKLGYMDVRELSSIPAFGNFAVHFSFVKQHATQRCLIRAFEQSGQALYNPMAKVDEVMDSVRNQMSEALVGDKNSMLTAAEMLEQTEESIGNDEVGFNTHMWKLDSIVAPIPAGSFVVIAGRPGMGKTTLYNSMQLHMGMHREASALFSMEMPVEQVTKRMVASIARYNSKPSEVHAAWNTQAMVDARETFRGLPIWCKDTPGMTERQIVREIKAMHAATGCKWYAIDHIGKVKCSKRCGSREEEVSVISNALKEVAMEIKGVIVGISQLNRMAEGNEPQLSHLRESGTIEQDADVVIFVHGKRDTDDDEQLRRVLAGQSIDMDIIIAKSRHTNPGRRMIPFYKHCSLFANDPQTEEEMQ